MANGHIVYASSKRGKAGKKGDIDKGSDATFNKDKPKQNRGKDYIIGRLKRDAESDTTAQALLQQIETGDLSARQAALPKRCCSIPI